MNYKKDSMTLITEEAKKEYKNNKTKNSIDKSLMVSFKNSKEINQIEKYIIKTVLIGNNKNAAGSLMMI